MARAGFLRGGAPNVRLQESRKIPDGLSAPSRFASTRPCSFVPHALIAAGVLSLFGEGFV